MTEKACTKCGVMKPLSEFGYRKTAKDKLAYRCLECGRKASRAYSLTPPAIYGAIKKRQELKQKKPFTITKEDFLEWFSNQSQECVYCGLKASELSLIDDRIINFSRRLTVDCIDNEKGYVSGNLAISCLRCNYLKNDFLSSDEMHEIGPKYVSPKWDAQLNDC